ADHLLPAVREASPHGARDADGQRPERVGGPRGRRIELAAAGAEAAQQQARVAVTARDGLTQRGPGWRADEAADALEIGAVEGRHGEGPRLRGAPPRRPHE